MRLGIYSKTGYFIAVAIASLVAWVAISQVPLPSNTKPKLCVQFNTVIDCTRYEIMWATNSFFVPYYVTFTSTNFLPVTELVYGSTYYVRMRCSQPSHSEWSTTSYYVATNIVIPQTITLWIESTTNFINWKNEGFIMTSNTPVGVQKFYRVRITK